MVNLNKYLSVINNLFAQWMNEWLSPIDRTLYTVLHNPLSHFEIESKDAWKSKDEKEIALCTHFYAHLFIYCVELKRVRYATYVCLCMNRFKFTSIFCIGTSLRWRYMVNTGCTFSMKTQMLVSVLYSLRFIN